MINEKAEPSVIYNRPLYNDAFCGVGRDATRHQVRYLLAFPVKLTPLFTGVSEDVDRDSPPNQTNIGLMKEHYIVNDIPSPVVLLQNKADKNEIKVMHMMSEEEDVLTYEKRVGVAVLLPSRSCDDTECDDDDIEVGMTDKR